MFMAAIMISVQPLLPTTKASEGYSFFTSRVPYRGDRERERSRRERSRKREMEGRERERDHYCYSASKFSASYE